MIFVNRAQSGSFQNEPIRRTKPDLARGQTWRVARLGASSDLARVIARVIEVQDAMVIFVIADRVMYVLSNAEKVRCFPKLDDRSPLTCYSAWHSSAVMRRLERP
jgi:hypothetical protein